MNEHKLSKYLASYKEWLIKNPSAANEAKQERMEAQQKAHAFTKDIPHNIYFGIKRHTPDLRL